MLRIDSNVEDTQAQVELGHTELLKYFKVIHRFSINGISIMGVIYSPAVHYSISKCTIFVICRV